MDEKSVIIPPVPTPREPDATPVVQFNGEHVEPIMQFFSYMHLPPDLAGISSMFYKIATTIVATLPRNPERSVALRKLLEAKDAAVRAKLYK